MTRYTATNIFPFSSHAIKLRMETHKDLDEIYNDFYNEVMISFFKENYLNIIIELKNYSAITDDICSSTGHTACKVNTFEHNISDINSLELYLKTKESSSVHLMAGESAPAAARLFSGLLAPSRHLSPLRIFPS